jgi:hypothetical protein
MVTVNIASTPDRKEQLYHTVFSLLDQVDKINICLNNYKKNPFEFMDRNSHKINVRFEDNSLGDAGRYLFLEETEGWYFTCDDDLIYNKYYIEDTIQRMTENNYKIASYHGRSFNSHPLESYYRDSCIKYRCLEEVKQDAVVEFGGTGVMAFHTSNFKPSLDVFKRANMSDIWVGIEARKQGIEINALSHESDYFRYQEVPNTIYDAKCKDDKIETEIINNYFNK